MFNATQLRLISRAVDQYKDDIDVNTEDKDALAEIAEKLRILDYLDRRVGFTYGGLYRTGTFTDIRTYDSGVEYALIVVKGFAYQVAFDAIDGLV